MEGSHSMGKLPARRLLLRWLCGVSSVDLIHYLFCPPDSIGNGADRGWNPRSTFIQRQLSSREDAGGDQEHALATFVHSGSLAVSPCVRYTG
jgi:hypothetical protein